MVVRYNVVSKSQKQVVRCTVCGKTEVRELMDLPFQKFVCERCKKFRRFA